MAKDSFVTNNLHRISNHIAESVNHTSGGSAGEDEGMLPTEKQVVQTVQMVETRTVPMPEMSKAVLRRHEDFLRTYRDLKGRLAQSGAEVESDLSVLDCQREKSLIVKKNLTEFQKRLEAFSVEEDVLPEPAKLGTDFKTLENLRLETIRVMARYGKERVPAGNAGQNLVVSNVPDWSSVTFVQLFRMGFSALLPLLLIILFSSLLLSAAIIAAFNGAFRW